MFISKKRYNDERELANRRMAEFENTLHELYDSYLDLKDKYNQLLVKNGDLSYRLEQVEQDVELRNGDKVK